MRFARAEGIEGEIVVHDGVAWIVKGIAHPHGSVIAFPRYSLAPPRKLSTAEKLRLASSLSRYWRFLDIWAPILPRTAIVAKPSRDLEQLIQLLELYVPNACRVIPTGSAAIGLPNANDLDAVVACPSSELCRLTYEALREMRCAGLLGESLGTLYREWLARHRSTISFESYNALKVGSPLIGKFANTSYTLRIVNMEFKPHKVLSSMYKEMQVVILRDVLSFTTPCRYIVYAPSLGKAILESYRLLFTELTPGTTVRTLFRIEYRADGVTYIIPDHSSNVEIR
ncbi:MAG: hypothetical protein GXO32_04130 [Crenarchaeota archaeon]|nr:hypothetical protein [Thermoproteota archaeon]